MTTNVSSPVDGLFGLNIPVDIKELFSSAPIWVADALGTPRYTPWYRSLFRSPDIGDMNGSWIGRISSNGYTDIVAYVLDSAENVDALAPAGYVAVRELIYVKGLTRYSALIESHYGAFMVKGVEIASLSRLVENRCRDKKLGRRAIASLDLRDVISTAVNGSACLGVRGIFRLRPPRFADNSPLELDIPAMVFCIEEAMGGLRVNAFCLNVLAQGLFGALVADIKGLSQAAAAHPVAVAAGPDLRMATAQSVQPDWPSTCPIRLDDARLNIIRFIKHREVLVSWNRGEMSNKEIQAAHNYDTAEAVTNLIYRLRKKHPELVRSGR